MNRDKFVPEKGQIAEGSQEKWSEKYFLVSLMGLAIVYARVLIDRKEKEKKEGNSFLGLL